MTRLANRLLLGALLFVSAATWAAGPAPAFDAVPTVVEMRSDAAVFGVDGLKGLRAVFDVKAAPERVVELLWDVARFREVFPDVKSVTVKEKGVNTVLARFTIDAVVQEAEYSLFRKLDPKRGEITWRERGEGDVKTIRGRWQTSAIPGGTRVIYESYVDVGRFVPTSLVRKLAIRKVGAMAERIRSVITATPK